MAVAAAVLPPAPSGAPSLDRRGVALLSISHGFNDISQSVVTAVLPFLIAQRHLSYTAAATLVLTLTIASSVVQPLFGYLTDKRSMPWLIPSSLLCTMLGIAMLGFAPTFGFMVLSTIVASIGSAAFHPEASRYTNLVSGPKRGTGMAYFSVGGNIGFALGPVLVTPAILVFGLHGTGVVVLPGVVFALYMWFVEMRRLSTFRTQPKQYATRAERGDRWSAFGILGVAISLRSVVGFGMMTFLPLFFIAVLGTTAAEANIALSITLAIAACGTVLGGRITDRFDRRAVMFGSVVAAGLVAGGIGLATAYHAPFLGIALLFPIFGFALYLSQSTGIVLGQEYLPTRIGTASGVTLGLAFSIGGLGAPVLGRLADTHGLIAVIFACCGLALAAAIPAAFLPPVSPRRSNLLEPSKASSTA